MAEQYQGARFDVVFTAELFDFTPACDALFGWCKRFDEIGLSDRYSAFGKPASGGNLSVRVPQGFVITSSAKLFSELRKDDLVLVSKWRAAENRFWANGSKKPSSETWLHALCYDARPDVDAIFHGHNAAILYEAPKRGAPVSAEQESGTLSLANAALSTARNSDFFILENHGFVSFGKNADEAGRRAEEWLYKCTGPNR